MGLVFLNDQTLKNIGDAIRAKLGSSTKLKPSQMAGAIGNIVTGSGEKVYPAEVYTQTGKTVAVNVANDKQTIAASLTAAASDVVKGKTVVNNDGLITGTHVCPTVAELTSSANATAADILKSKTAYVDGEKLTGTHVCPTVGDLTADANASASDIASGKTAYVNGTKVSGSLFVVGSTQTLSVNAESLSVNGDEVSVKSQAMASDKIVRTGVKVQTDIPFSSFGDATAADVAAGKTFTSAAGLKVTGEAAAGGGYEETEIAYTGFGSAGTLDIYHTLSNVDTFYLVCSATSSNGLNNRITSLAKYDSSKCVYNYITSSGGTSVGVKGFSYTIDSEKVSVSIPKGYSFYPSKIVVTG